MTDIAFGKTDTSIEAALKLMPRLPKMRATVYSGFFNGPKTCSEVAHDLGLDKTMVRPRVTELQKHGLLEDTGTRRLNKWGNNEIVWKKKDN